MLQSSSSLWSPRPGRCGGRQEWERAVACRRQVSTPLPWTLDTAEGPGMKSPQSECKVHRGDLDQVHLAEKHRGLSLHNPAATGSAPAAPGLQLPQKVLSRVCPSKLCGTRDSLHCPTLSPACWEVKSFSLSRIPPLTFFLGLLGAWGGGVRHPPSLASGGIAPSTTCGTTGLTCGSCDGVPHACTPRPGCPAGARPGQKRVAEAAVSCSAMVLSSLAGVDPAAGSSLGLETLPSGHSLGTSPAALGSAMQMSICLGGTPEG